MRPVGARKLSKRAQSAVRPLARNLSSTIVAAENLDRIPVTRARVT